MIQISFAEMLQTLWKLITENILFIILLVGMLILFVILFVMNQNHKEQKKQIFIILYFGILVALLIAYHSGIGTLLNYLMDHVFVLFYFPNLALYALLIVLTNIIMLKSIFSTKIEKEIKAINLSAFCILHYFLILILSVIGESKIDIFSEKSVYTNQNLVALIQLSTGLFVVWMLLLFVYRKLKQLQPKKSDGNTLVTEQPSINNEVSFQSDYVQPTFIDNAMYYPKKKEKSWQPVQLPRAIKGPAAPKTKVVENGLPMEDPFTLEDYKTMLELLSEKKKKEQQVEK